VTTGDLVARVEAALRALAAADQAVTFTAVAEHAGLGRATLYRNPTLRALVEDHRLSQIDTRTLSGLSTEIAHLRTALEAIAERVRGHEERLRRLESRRAARSS
jgi:DNA-binding IclR family transcriptional regulator